MTPDLTQGLLVISLIAIACAIFAPILWWILPNRSKTAELRQV